MGNLIQQRAVGYLQNTGDEKLQHNIRDTQKLRKHCADQNPKREGKNGIDKSYQENKELINLTRLNVLNMDLTKLFQHKFVEQGWVKGECKTVKILIYHNKKAVGEI